MILSQRCPRQRSALAWEWLNSNKGTKSDMGGCPSHSALESYTYVEPPIIGPIQAANFGSLIPTGSRRWAPEICCHDITEPLAPTCRSRLHLPEVESLLANGSGQKFISRDYHTTGADLHLQPQNA